jgi:peroxiredoxin
VSWSISICHSAERSIAAGALLLTLGLLACGAQPGAAPRTVGDEPAGQATEFSLRDTQGRMVHLSDHLGRDVVLVNFWATWCGPCAGEMPLLQQLYERHRSEGFVVLGIAMDGPETVASVSPVARGYGVSFPILLDEETRVVGLYNPKRAAPLSILIGRSGRIASVHEGFTPSDAEGLEQEITALLSAHGN